MASQDLSLTVGTRLAGGSQQAFSAVATGMRTVAEGIRVNATALAELGKAAKLKSLTLAAESMNKLATAAEKQVANVEKLVTAQTKEEKVTTKSAAAIDKKTQALARASDALAKEAAEEKEAAESAEASAKAIIAEQAALTKKSELIQHLRVVYYQLIQGKNKYATASRKIIANLQKGEIASRKAADGIIFLNKQYRLSVTTAKKLNVNLSTLRITYHELLNGAGELSVAANKVINSFVKQSASTAKQKVSISELRAELKRLSVAYKETGNSQRGVDINARKTASTIKKLAITYKELIASGGQYARSFTRLTELYRKGSITIEQLRANLNHLATAYKKNVAKSEQLALAQQRVYATFPKYGKQIAMLEKQGIAVKEQISLLHRYSAAQEQAASKVGTFRKGIKRLLYSFKAYASYIVASSVIFALIGIFREAARAIIEYDQALKDLQAITKSSDAVTALMGAKILQVASDTKFSAKEVADGMRVLGQAGFSAYESINTIGAVSDLATGTLTGLSTTVDLVTTALRVFGIKARDSRRVVDVFANAVNRSKLTIDKMRIAMNYIGPIASASGISLEEVTAAMMTMANQGIRASTIGTGLRQVFRRLVDPSVALEKGLHKVGLTLADINPKTHSLANILTKLQKVVKGNADAFQMFGRRGATAVIALTKKGGEGLLTLLSIVNRSGSAADMAATQMEGLGISFKNLQDKIKNLYIAGGKNGLAGMLRMLVDSARGLVDLFTGILNNALVQVIAKFALAAGAAQLLVLAFKWFIKSSLFEAVFAPIIAGLDAFSAAITETTISMTTMEATLSGLGAAMWSFLPAALIMAIVYAIQKISLLNAKLAANIRQLGAQKLELKNNIMALDAFNKKLAGTTLSYSDHANIISKLIDKYPELAGKIVAAKGDFSKIQVVLEKFNKTQKALLKEKSLEKLGEEFTLFHNKLAKSLPNEDLKSAWLGLTRGSDAARSLVAVNNQKISKSVKKLVDDFKVLKKLYPNINIDQFISKMHWGAAKTTITKKIKGIMEAEKLALKDGQKNLSETAKQTLYKLLSPEELKVVATDLGTERDKAMADSESALQKNLYDISVLEAEGVDSHADAEKKKLEVTAVSYQKQLAIAKDYLVKITETGSFTEVAKAEKRVASIQKQTNQARLRELQLFSERSELVKKKIVMDTAKAEKEKQTYSQTTATLKKQLLKATSDYNKTISAGMLAIDKKYAADRLRIESAAQEKLKQLAQKRKDIEESTQNAIAGIQDSTQDKILKIQQRGLKGIQKQTSEQNAANDRLEKGIALVSKAKEKSDKGMLARAQQLIQKAGDYYDSLKDSGAAISGLKKVGLALEHARKIQGELALNTLDKQVAKVRSVEAAKLELMKQTHESDLMDFKKKEVAKFKIAKTVLEDRIKLEKTRHIKEMDHLRDEIALLKNKLHLIQESAQAVANNIGGGQATFSTGGPVLHMAGGGRLPGKDSQEDKIPLWARPGEWFIRNESAQHWTDKVGSWFMGAVNAPGSLSGKHLESMLGMNANMVSRSLALAKSAVSGAGNQLRNLGVININLPTEGPAIPALMNPMDAAEFIKQLNTMQRLAS